MRLYTLLLMTLLGCASARVTGFRDPALAEISYNNVAVFFPSTDLEVRTQVEDQLARRLGESRISAGAVAAIISPTESPKPREFARRLKKAGYDSLLIISDSTASSKSSYVPGSLWVSGGSITYIPGFTVTSVGIKSNATFVDLNSGKVAWIGTASGAGNNSYSVITAMVDVIVERLVAEQVVAPVLVP